MRVNAAPSSIRGKKRLAAIRCKKRYGCGYAAPVDNCFAVTQPPLGQPCGLPTYPRASMSEKTFSLFPGKGKNYNTGKK
jgi:hypothetical protein